MGCSTKQPIRRPHFPEAPSVLWRHSSCIVTNLIFEFNSNDLNLYGFKFLIFFHKSLFFQKTLFFHKKNLYFSKKNSFIFHVLLYSEGILFLYPISDEGCNSLTPIVQYFSKCIFSQILFFKNWIFHIPLIFTTKCGYYFWPLQLRGTALSGRLV